MSKSDGTWTKTWQKQGDGSGVLDHPTLTGDVNGDGRTDLIFVGSGWKELSQVIRRKPSNGKGTWTAVGSNPGAAKTIQASAFNNSFALAVAGPGGGSAFGPAPGQRVFVPVQPPNASIAPGNPSASVDDGLAALLQEGSVTRRRALPPQDLLRNLTLDMHLG